jgi:hypothetical protein
MRIFQLLFFIPQLFTYYKSSDNNKILVKYKPSCSHYISAHFDTKYANSFLISVYKISLYPSAHFL